jgi:hypothetical protein
MSAGPKAAEEPLMPTGKLRAFGLWLAVSVAGVALLFALSARFSVSDRSPGVFGIALGAVAGWGLGRWAAIMNLAPNLAVAIAAWLCIGVGEVCAAVKTNHDRVADLRKLAIWQETPGDPISEPLRRHLSEEPPGESSEDRDRRLKDLAELERGDAVRKQRMQHLTFYGYLSSRIPKTWGRWEFPWPALFWAAEVLSASTLGAWMTLNTLRAASSGIVDGSHDARRDEPPSSPH